MLRKLITLTALTALLGACATQEQIDAANAQRDAAYCSEIGIAKDDSRYALCRVVAAQLRMQATAAEAQRNAAMSQSLLGAGALINSMNPPPQTLIVR